MVLNEISPMNPTDEKVYVRLNRSLLGVFRQTSTYVWVLAP